MSWKSVFNQHLKVESQVDLNDLLDVGVVALDKWFEKLPSFVTSGDRTYAKQLEVIRDVAIRFAGLANVHPNLKIANMDLPYTFQGQLVPFWKVVWSECLQKRVMVNPPIESACLLPYTHVDGRQLPAGHIVGVSTHQLHQSFDIGGGTDLQARGLIVKLAFDSKTIPEFHGYLIEGGQNCVHTDWRRTTTAEPAVH